MVFYRKHIALFYMKKKQNIFIFIAFSLLGAALTGIDLYFYRPGILDSLPKFLWVPFSLGCGLLLGLLSKTLWQKITGRVAHIRWVYIILFIFCTALLVFSLKELYYFPLTPNAFSQTKVTIKAAETDSKNDVIIDMIRVDQREPKRWNAFCQITGPYHYASDGVLVLENTPAGQGVAECAFYPLKSLHIIFHPNTYQQNIRIGLDGKEITEPAVSTANGDIVNIDISMGVKEIVANILIFLNVFFVVFLLVMLWVAFQAGGFVFSRDKDFIWVLSAYLLGYVFFFIFPIYFNDQHVMDFPQSFTAFPPVGMDFHWIYTTVQSVILHGQPLLGTFYSPGSFYAFVPFALIDYFLAYKIYTLIKLAFFISAIFFASFLGISKKEYALPLSFLLTGLTSYGMAFELERGQGYSLVFSLLVISIVLFHRYYEKRPVRYLAYFLFIIAVQMKLTPAFFVVFFIRNWRDFGANIKRIAVLGLINFLLVFSTGINNGLNFIHSIVGISSGPSLFSNVENHSISSFLIWTQSFLLNPDLAFLANSLVGITCLCLIFLFAHFVLDKIRGTYQPIDPFLFMGLSLAALLLPNENHDYTLVILPIVLCFGFCVELSYANCRLNGMDLFILSFLYSITLFSHVVKLDLAFIQNNCLTLLTLLVYLTVTAWKQDLAAFLFKGSYPGLFAPDLIEPLFLSANHENKHAQTN
jgi:hypothetical protein